jgi:hypothetical protein
MTKPPRIAALILCKRMEVIPARVEMSLVGVFNSLQFSTWPTPPYPFTVYTELYDAEGEGTMDLDVMRLETEQVIYRRPRWFASSDRGLTFPVEWRVRKCCFPAPGRYMLTLRLDGTELSRRFLDVKQKETAP